MQSNREKYSHLDQKPYDSSYLLVETVIDHPIEKVWREALKIGRWMNAHRLETLSGKAGEVGHFERVHPRSLKAGTPGAHYHLYGIAYLIPFKLIALEVLPEKGGSYGQPREWASFDTILLTDLGGVTQVRFLKIDVYRGKGDATFHQYERTKLEEGREMLEGYFENLKQQVAAAR